MGPDRDGAYPYEIVTGRDRRRWQWVREGATGAYHWAPYEPSVPPPAIRFDGPPDGPPGSLLP
ncbi:hypothetical protein [Cellulomonas endophytica]|uniref:hypothetical protein n=1 Tax=Cellulomonas endophytica TaxID=2494735 RepID=UPI0010108C57|nr:hypothetical protein [Cellulomonas endophytica]